MKYNPEETTQCLPAGEYYATVARAVEATSKAGNDMIVVSFAVYPPNGEVVEIKEYIVFPATGYKLKRLAQAIGKLDAFATGEFNASDYLGESLTVELTVQESEKFGDQNKIKSFSAKLPGGKSSPAPVTRKPTPPLTQPPLTEDDIPF